MMLTAYQSAYVTTQPLLYEIEAKEIYGTLKTSYVPLTLSDPGYFRQLTIREPPPPPPPTISKTILSIFNISYMCILSGEDKDEVELEFFKNLRFWPFYSDFKIKSSENSCKNNIFVTLFKIDFKYTKRCRILMRI